MLTTGPASSAPSVQVNITACTRDSFQVVARYVEALGGRLDLVADFGDRTVRLPVSKTAA
jgi:hypothetical protein